jgi:hypothetical protein
VLAVSEYLWDGPPDESLRRASNALSGGFGNSHGEACGVLSGGALVIGVQHGRLRPDADDSRCLELVRAYRERFARELGATNCGELRDGASTVMPCDKLIERAALILIEVLESASDSTNNDT